MSPRSTTTPTRLNRESTGSTSLRRRIVAPVGGALLLALAALPAAADAQEVPFFAAQTTASVDTDGDGLFDADELALGTDPNLYDTDGDGFGDNHEVYSETDPLDPTSAPAGTPGAGLDDDGDLLSNGEEWDLGTDPNDPDTDDDGLSDFAEVGFEPGSGTGTDPLDADSDDDRLSDGFEVREFGTDPLKWDSDGDGYGDGDELEVHQTDALDPASHPRDEEPAPAPARPTAPPVKALPNTGAGPLTTPEAGDDALLLVLAASIVVVLAGASAAARRGA